MSFFHLNKSNEKAYTLSRGENMGRKEKLLKAIEKSNKKHHKKKEKINEILEIPLEVVSREPKITVMGFKEILIENYKAILEYEEFYIKINTHTGVININGFNLKLKEMTDDDIMVLGKIDSIDFEEITDEE